MVVTIDRVEAHRDADVLAAGAAHDLAVIVDAVGTGDAPSIRGEEQHVPVVQRAAGIQEGNAVARGLGCAHKTAALIHVVDGRLAAAKEAEVGHHAVLVEEHVKGAVHFRVAGDLTRIVDLLRSIRGARPALCQPDLCDGPVQTFQAFTSDLERMANWLVATGTKTVVVESSGVYWAVAYEVLKSHCCTDGSG